MTKYVIVQCYMVTKVHQSVQANRVYISEAWRKFRKATISRVLRDAGSQVLYIWLRHKSEAHWSRNFPDSNWRRRPIEENSGCVVMCCYEGPRGGQEFKTGDGKSHLVCLLETF